MNTFQFGSSPGESLGIILVGLILVAAAFLPSTWWLGGAAARDDHWKRLGMVALGLGMIGWAFVPSSRFSRLTAARTVVVLEYETPKRDVTLRPADIASVRWKLTTIERSRRLTGPRSVEVATLAIKTVHGKTYRSASVTPEAARAMEYDIDRWVAAPARAAQPAFELPLRLPHSPPDVAAPPR